MMENKIKKYKNFIFVENNFTSVKADVSDGYITHCDGERIKLPHNNFTILGIADECINAPYAEKFSAEIVEKGEFGGYLDYMLKGDIYDSASDSFQTLAIVLDLNKTDIILRDETN